MEAGAEPEDCGDVLFPLELRKVLVPKPVPRLLLDGEAEEFEDGVDPNPDGLEGVLELEGEEERPEDELPKLELEEDRLDEELLEDEPLLPAIRTGRDKDNEDILLSPLNYIRLLTMIKNY